MGLHSEWGAARFVFTTTYLTKENSESGNLALNMTTKETTGRIYAPARNAGRQLKVGAAVVKEQTNRYSRYPSTDVGHSK